MLICAIEIFNIINIFFFQRPFPSNSGFAHFINNLNIVLIWFALILLGAV